MTIERLDPNNEPDCQQIADLHSEYLSDSPIVQFGPAFLRSFFYRSLIRDGLVGVSHYRHEGQIRGFISYTTQPLGFMKEGIRRHPLRLAWALTSGVIRRPATAVDISRVLRLMRDRELDEQAGHDDGTGEVISLVVSKDYRGHVPEDGEARVAVRLFEDAIDFFRSEGIERTHLLVQPSNLESNLFCSSMGAAFGKIEFSGETVHRYTYEIPPAAAPEAVS